MDPKPKFEELDYRQTALGELSLRRRTVAALNNLDVYEIVLGDAFLMSSLFTEVEKALAVLGLAAVGDSDLTGALDVVVGGLGLGYTARAALDYPGVRSVEVIDYLEPVIEWHQEGLVPLGAELTADPRCQFVHGDFFELALSNPSKGGFNPTRSGDKYHAVLLDIDHSPKNLLHERNADLYRPEGLRKLAEKLHPGGVFALWSDEPPEEDLTNSLHAVFPICESNVVAFHNPIQDRESASTVYVAKLGS